MAISTALFRRCLGGLGAILRRPAARVPTMASSILSAPGCPAVLARPFSRSAPSHAHRHKNLLKKAKGYRNRAKNVYSVALQRVQKAMQYAYR